MTIRNLFRRSGTDRGSSSAPLTAREAMERADALVNDDKVIEAVDLLASVPREERDGALEIRLRDLRRAAAGLRATSVGRESWPPVYDDPFPDVRDEIPEIRPELLSAETVGGSVFHHGSLIVRGLLDAAAAGDALSAVKRAKAAQSDGSETDPGWYDPVDTGVTQDANLRGRAARNGGIFLADSPTSTTRMLDHLKASAVVASIEDHLGERPAFSLQKSSNLFNFHQPIYY